MSFRLNARAGEWALITGASSGLGAEFARALARRGYSLLLHGRNAERLEQLVIDLNKVRKLDCRVVIADLAREEGIDAVCQAARHQAGLRLLVNNAGYGNPGLFQDVSVDSLLEMQRVHNEAVVRITHAAMAQLMQAEGAAVLNVSSVAAWLPGRGSVMYYATKAFLNAFSRSLAADLSGTGVVVQALCPGFTHTGFHDPDKAAYLDKSKLPNWLWMEAAPVVEFSLRSLGNGRVIVIPGVVNRIFAWVGGHDWLYRKLVGNARRK